MSWIIAALVVLAGACVLLEVAHRRLVAKVAGHQQDIEWLAGRCDELERRIAVDELAISRVAGTAYMTDERVRDMQYVLKPILTELRGQKKRAEQQKADAVDALRGMYPTDPLTSITVDEPELAAKHDELVAETIKTAKKGEPVIW